MNSIWSSVRSLLWLSLMGMMLAGCGGDGGENEDDAVPFKSDDLLRSDWYANTMYHKTPTYDLGEGLEVLRFKEHSQLQMVEYGGRRIFDAGTWDLNNDELLINKLEQSPMQWYILPSSTSEQLVLSDKIAVRKYFTEINGLKDVFADVYVVNEYYNFGQSQGYRYEVNLEGKGISKAIVLFKNGTKYDLMSVGDDKWRISDESAAIHFGQFKGEEVVQIYLKFDSGIETKLSERIYDSSLDKLDYKEVKSDHGTGTNKLEVKWIPLESDKVYYQVYVMKALDQKNVPDEIHPVFVSNIQKPGAEKIIIDVDNNPDIDAVENHMSQMQSGDLFFVKVVALAYEPDMDIDNFKFESYNIQSTTQYMVLGGNW